MLDTLRSAAGTWVAKLLLLLLVVSFAIWGISGQLIQGVGSGNVLTVGDTSVSAKDYRLAYDRQLNVWGQQLGQRLTREQATAFGVDQQVLSQLIAGAVLDEQARKLGLGLSKDRLASLTREDPAFAGPDGRFDRQRFDFVLREVGMTPEDYLRNRQDVAVREQIVEAVSDGLKAPAAFLNAAALYSGEDRTVDYLVPPKSLVEPIEDPSDAVLPSWFEGRKANYAAPEYRRISYVKLEPEDIADTSAISDDQVAKDYEANKARYTTPERRTIEQIVFKSEDAASKARAAIDAGSTFDDIARAEGKTAADMQLGTLARDRIPDPAVAQAAFALDANQVSGVVKGAFGPVLVRVTTVEPEVVRPLDQVKEEIRKSLAADEASRILLDVHDAYEDARAGGASMREAAEKLKLKVVTVEAIDRTALRPDGTIVSDLPQSRDLIRAAFEAEANTENAPLNIGTDGFLFYEVDSVTTARDRALDEVRAKVIADWKADQAGQRLAAKAAEIEKRVRDGATLDAIATELSLVKQTKRGLKREADDADFGKTGVAAVFGVAPNGIGTTPAPDGGAQIVFKVTEVFEPAASGPDALPEQVRANFTTAYGNDLLEQMAAMLQAEYGVSVDRGAIAQALAF
ncbi:peptidylprolyl isomerase [Mesorhizobium sp. L-8-10]|uniref:SurA N-terminal domain-containing protein n=1 Tax=Mesorhizobium sp. L-8-10 TaxID=2744523 RepID=UPI0019265E19|nr:SurA N-terminal domain-containing protein [Mesorhizobium sp. L-8-10]BCH32729.1 peptidylprolyl isomerase [Mesorhizobium sp. L-8-10]